MPQNGKNFKIYFLKNWSTDFFEIFTTCTGPEPLPVKEVSQHFIEGKNITTFPKFQNFKNS